jgi:hypothetical protein
MLANLMDGLHPHSVRLVVFNLDHQQVVYSDDPFAAAQIDAVSKAIGALDLSRVAVGNLQPGAAPALLNNLIAAEFAAAEPSDTVVFLGPRSAVPAARKEALAKPKPAGPRFFYIQYAPLAPLSARPAPVGRVGMESSGIGDAPPPLARQRSNDADLPGTDAPDPIERAVARLKGETIAIRRTADFAAAVKRIRARESKR